MRSLLRTAWGAMEGWGERHLEWAPLSWVSKAILARRGLPRHAIPAGALAVCVGAKALGGSGKTPLAIALARVLAERWPREVALVGHAAGARPQRPRRVTPHDRVQEVGDEALLAVHHFAGRLCREPAVEIPVWVAPRRGDALEHAAKGASILVVDGLLSARPAARVLSVDAVAPQLFTRTSHGCFHRGRLLAWSEVPRRASLATCEARPERLVSEVLAQGLAPQTMTRAPNHSPPQVGSGAWIVSGKGAMHFASHASLYVVEDGLQLSPSYVGSVLRWVENAHLSGHVGRAVVA